MAADKQRVPAIDGWFTLDEDAPALLAQRCDACATIVFPPRATRCPNPACRGDSFTTQPLGRTGRIWSYTTNHYAPPEPYVAPEPFAPYTVAAVELPDERIVVLGQVSPAADPADLRVGDEVELVVGSLYADDEHDYVTWQWRPTGATA